MVDARNVCSATAVLGARVRGARMQRNVSVRALARMLDVSPATISQIENGHTELSVSRLSRIADALGTTASDILNSSMDSGTSPPASGSAPPEKTDPDLPDVHCPCEPVAPQFSHWRNYKPLDFDSVLRAALHEILDVGYHGATMRSIAARSGLSVSGIYHHYTSKQHMLVTILERTMTEFLARARAARREGRGPVQRFSLLIEHLVLFHTHRRELGFVRASEIRSLDELNRRAIADMQTTQQRMLDEEVQDAVRLGYFRHDHPHEAVHAAVSMCTALANWWQPGGRVSPEKTAEQYVGFALALMRENSMPPVPGSGLSDS